MRRVIGNVDTPKKKFEDKSSTQGKGYIHNSTVSDELVVPSTHSMVLAGPVTVSSTGSLVVNGTLVIV